MTAAGGWLKLHRSLGEHRFWLREPVTIGQAWVDLLLLANYQDGTAIRGNRVLSVRRGQVLTSLEHLRTRWKRDRKTIRAWLLAFERDGMLARESAYGPAGGYTLLTIRNFERYQGRDAEGLDRALDRVTDGALDLDTDRALDRGLPRALPQIEEREERKEVREHDERASVPVNGHGAIREIQL